MSRHHSASEAIADGRFFVVNSDPNKLAATWRVYFDHGAAFGDCRAVYRKKGDA